MTEKRIIGVDIGGTTTKIACITYDGLIVEKCEIPTANEDNGRIISDRISQAISQLLDDDKEMKDQIAGIGVGAPGPVNQAEGILYETTNLAWVDNYPLKNILEKCTGLPVMINNDANCAALGEMWRGAGEDAKDLVCITLGTGIGGGVIVNGNIVQGIRGAAGEIGHFTSVITGGAPCNCGKSGCLETVASATGIVRLAMERVRNHRDRSNKLTTLLNENGRISAKDVFDLAGLGDVTAMDVVAEAVQYLGIALANIANTLNPKKIVIGGGVSKAGDILLEPLKRYFAIHAFPFSATSTEIALAKLGNDAGVIGAAWMIKNRT